jgi:hypothetical protein
MSRTVIVILIYHRHKPIDLICSVSPVHNAFPYRRDSYQAQSKMQNRTEHIHKGSGLKLVVLLFILLIIPREESAVVMPVNAKRTLLRMGYK